MSRYIDADRLIERLKHNPNFLTAPKHSKDGIIDEIVYQPTADVVEVVHARWIGRKSRDYYTCSNCCTVSKSKDDEYCRGCGAKMDGERREE